MRLGEWEMRFPRLFPGNGRVVAGKTLGKPCVSGLPLDHGHSVVWKGRLGWIVALTFHFVWNTNHQQVDPLVGATQLPTCSSLHLIDATLLPGDSNVKEFLVILGIDPVLDTNAHKSPQTPRNRKRPQIAAKRPQKKGQPPAKKRTNKTPREPERLGISLHWNLQV